MRPIDADALWSEAEYDSKFRLVIPADRVENAPTLTPPEIVYCQDCIHHENGYIHWCNKWEHICPDDAEFFVNLGGRKMAVRPIDGDALKNQIRHMPRTVNPDLVRYSLVQAIIAGMPTLTPQNEPLTCEFDVVDTKTGEYPDLWKIALTEEWAKGLMYCDMDGFAIREDGSLILLDECGNCVSCPQGRFELRRPPEKEDVL